MKALRGWRKHKGTRFLERWDKGTSEVHITHAVPQMCHPRGGKTQVRYFVEGSESVGGFYPIGDSKTKSGAVKIVKEYMRGKA